MQILEASEASTQAVSASSVIEIVGRKDQGVRKLSKRKGDGIECKRIECYLENSKSIFSQVLGGALKHFKKIAKIRNGNYPSVTQLGLSSSSVWVLCFA